MLFLREAPLVEGEWIDAHVVELAEWGALMRAKGFRLVEPIDNSPFAWWRFVSKAGDEETPDEADKLRATHMGA